MHIEQTFDQRIGMKEVKKSVGPPVLYHTFSDPGHRFSLALAKWLLSETAPSHAIASCQPNKVVDFFSSYR